MKRVSVDYKKGVAKVMPEHADDLWYLSQIIEPGDRVSGRTMRKIKVGEDDRKQQVVKKPMFLTLEVEKVELTEASLRILGTITAGPEDIPKGEHHSFAIEPNDEVSIKKDWPTYQKNRLEETFKAKQHTILITVLDREEAHIAKLVPQGVEHLSTLKGDVAKKGEDTVKHSNFYVEIISALKDLDQRLKPSHIIVASPAFWKEDFMKELNDEQLKKKIVLATCSSADRNAFDEVLKREELKSVLAQDRAAKEMILVDELMKEISTGSKAAYGIDETEKAALAGAVENLLVTDAMIQKSREDNVFERLDAIMKAADKAQGEVHIISHHHEGGQKLQGLGGIAAILRYAL